MTVGIYLIQPHEPRFHVQSTQTLAARPQFMNMTMMLSCMFSKLG